MSEKEIKIVILGLGAKLDMFLNYFRNVQNVNVIGIVSLRKQIIRFVDGIPVWELEDLKEQEFDLIFVLDEALKRNPQIEHSIRHKMVDEKLFHIPNFCIEKYLKIRSEEWCIISEDCWASLFYHYLQLQFTSPFIMTRIQDEDYYRLLGNLDLFLKQDLELEREENELGYAIGRLGTSTDGVKVDLFHYRDFESAKKKWVERLKRVSADSPILIQKTIKSDEDAYRFSQLPYENKIGFYHKKMELEGIVYLEGWNDREIRYRYNWIFNNYVREMVRSANETLITYDVWQLFGNGEAAKFNRFS